MFSIILMRSLPLLLLIFREENESLRVAQVMSRVPIGLLTVLLSL